ncbi:hypothetical protein G5S37_20275 [Roseimicrobium sp. ORNL1]|nr:hypothetical protein G5S37_20275 [Roseimicrobium sp. ORNL1]
MHEVGGTDLQSKVGDQQVTSLGPLMNLVGKWASVAQGWNLIALPFRDPSAQFKYRLLMNQYGENLDFFFVDENIPNRGIQPDADDVTDQLISGLDYQQVVIQVAAEDSPASNLRSPDGKGIHHEPGLFLHLTNHRGEHEGEELSIARLATIPHGDSVLALGKVRQFDGPPKIPDLNALPVRVNQDVNANPYLGPYKHFEDNRFFGTVPKTVPKFPGFFASNANAILQFANPGEQVVRTTELHFDTKFGTGGIANIPFVVREANATEMVATFWIMELKPTVPLGPPQFVMQYSQTVFLDFFPAPGQPGQLIRWPHVSINTLTKA